MSVAPATAHPELVSGMLGIRSWSEQSSQPSAQVLMHFKVTLLTGCRKEERQTEQSGNCQKMQVHWQGGRKRRGHGIFNM